MRKSQSTLEFALIIAFMMLIFTGILFVISVKSQETKEQIEVKAIEELSESIEGEIKLAKSVSDGYSRQFFVPEKLNDQYYSISIIGNRELVIKSGEDEHIAFLPDGVQGNIKEGVNLIEKKDGIVYVQGIGTIANRITFKNSQGENAARFNNEGDIILKGELFRNYAYTPTEQDEFLIRGADGGVLFTLNLDSGNLYIKGILYDNQQISASENDITKFLDEDGNIVIKIDNNGNLYLAGGLTQKGNP